MNKFDAIAHNISWGAKRGLRVGGVFALIAFVLNLPLQNAAYERFGLTPVTGTALYLLAGLTGGSAVGVLRPKFTSALRAALGGAVAFLPLVMGTRIVKIGIGDWTIREAFVLSIALLTMGAIWGPKLWRASREEQSRRDDAAS